MSTISKRHLDSNISTDPIPPKILRENGVIESDEIVKGNSSSQPELLHNNASCDEILKNGTQDSDVLNQSNNRLLLDLPNELLLEIFSTLTSSDLCSLMQCCRRIRSLVLHSEKLWQGIQIELVLIGDPHADQNRTNQLVRSRLLHNCLRLNVRPHQYRRRSMHFRLPPDFFRRVIGEKCIAIQELTLDSVDLLSTLQKISVSRTLQRLRLIRCNVNDSMPVVYVNVQNRFECLTHLTLSNLRVSLALLPSFSPSFSLKYLELSSCNRLVSDTDFRLSDLYTTALDSFRDGRLSVYDMRELLLPPPLVPCTPLQYHSFRRSIVTAEENAQHQTTRLKHLFLFPALEQLVFRDSPLTASFAVLLVRYMARFRDPSSVESHSRLRLLDLRGTGDALRGDTTAVRLIRALVPTTDVLADVPHHRDSSS